MSFASQSLSRWAELAKFLNNAAKTVETVETSLAKSRVGVTASVTVKTTMLSDTMDRVTQLACRRIDGKFRIVVLQVLRTPNQRDVKMITPWGKCPLNVRRATFAYLRQLLEAIVTKAKTAQAKSEQTQQAVNGILAGLSPSTPQSNLESNPRSIAL